MIFLHTCSTAQQENKVMDCSQRVTGFTGGWGERLKGTVGLKIVVETQLRPRDEQILCMTTACTLHCCCFISLTLLFVCPRSCLVSQRERQGVFGCGS